MPLADAAQALPAPRHPPGPAAGAPAPSRPDTLERIGLVLVHGIGEQRRFQHLDSQLRALLRALLKLGYVATVDVKGAASAAFHAEQDTWTAGPGASVVVSLRRCGSPDVTRELHVHEVWWADINEPYSIAKQLRFWFWGLAVWAGLAKRGSTLPSAHEVESPTVGGARRPWFLAWARIRLYLVGFVFALGGMSVGVAAFLATRLFHWQPPRLLRVVTNYVSGVKLYSERHRHGPGLGLGAEPQELLDNVGCPPRTSVRRRMIRTIADVACPEPGVPPYDRWYVFAHSLGSIVAFNGLMETGYAWPGYLDSQRWKRLRTMGIICREPPPPPSDHSPIPPRPAWTQPDERVDRSGIFRNFRGFLTYGSPLEKFATIWPARVPLSLRPAFHPTARWFNVFDPTDPVSGVLRSFPRDPKPAPPDALHCCPAVVNIGYRSYWVLLQSHLHYLTARRGPGNDLATQAMRWVLDDAPWHMAAASGPARSIPPIPGSFEPGSATAVCRTAIAVLWWLAAVYALAGLAGAVLPDVAWIVRRQLRGPWLHLGGFPLLEYLLHWDRRTLLREALGALWRFLAGSWIGVAAATTDSVLCQAGTRLGLPARSGSFVLAALVGPLVLGGVFRGLSRPDADAPK